MEIKIFSDVIDAISKVSEMFLNLKTSLKPNGGVYSRQLAKPLSC